MTDRKLMELCDAIMELLPMISTKEELESKFTTKELEKAYEKMCRHYHDMELLCSYYQRHGIVEYQFQLTEEIRNMRASLSKLKKLVPLSDGKVAKRDAFKQKIKAELEAIDYDISDTSVLFDAYWQEASPFQRISILKKIRSIYQEENRVLSIRKQEKMRALHSKVAQIYHIDLRTKMGKNKLNELLKRMEFLPTRMYVSSISEKLKKGNRCVHDIDRLMMLEKSALHDSISLEIEDDYGALEVALQKDAFGEKYLRFLTDLRSSQYLARYSTRLLDMIPEEIREILDEIKLMEKEKRTLYASLGRDIVRNRRRVMKKGFFIGMDIEISFFRKMEQEFSSLISLEDFKEEEEDTSIYYKMMELLLQDDRNFTYINRLLDCSKGFLQARKEMHILLFLFDCFTEQYRIKLMDQGLPYIDPTFYLEVMCAYFSHGVELTEEERKLFSMKIDHFSSFMREKNYFHSPEVLQDLSRISVSFHGMNEENLPPSFSALQDEYMNFYHLREKVFDLRRNGAEYFWKDAMETFQIEGISNYAFSVQEVSSFGEKLSIHILDTSEFIDSDSQLGREMKEGRRLSVMMEPGIEYPCRTFSYTFSLDGKVSDVSITSSVVTFDTVYHKEDIDSYRNIPSLKRLFGMFHRINQKYNRTSSYHDISQINSFVSEFLGHDLASIFEQMGLPFLYQRQLESEEKLVLSNYNQICSYLSELDQKEAHQIFAILNQTPDVYYVSCYQGLEKVELDSTTYLGLLLLEQLQKLKENRFSEKTDGKRIQSTLIELNQKRGYLPSRYFAPSTFQKEAVKVKEK